jgi:membrane dipeptidase
MEMGRNKDYSGYEAYQYLEPGTDYKVFRLRKAVIDEWSYKVPLSKAEEQRFEEVMEKNIVISLHEHPVLYPEDISQTDELTREGRQFMAYEALSMSGLDCVFDNLMDGTLNIYTKHGWDWMGTVHDLGMRLCDIAHQDFVIHCKKVEDIIEAHDAGRLAWVAALESSSCIGNEVDRIDILYGLGLRAMGVCYNESNMLGTGLSEPKDGGLTDFGYDAVVRMNKLGMLIDVSHASEKTVLDTIEESKKPIVISHCGTRTLTSSIRMLPDNALQALAEKGGVLGVEMAGAMVRTEKNPVASLEAYMEHVEYCIDLMGIDHVGCGPDTLYGDHIGWYRSSAAKAIINGSGHVERKGVSGEQVLGISTDLRALPEYVKGMENPTECVQNVARWMVKDGYSDREVAKVVGGNAVQLLRQVW